jgi:hypothetical protein
MKPDRLIYLSSGDHRHGSPNLEKGFETQAWLAVSNDPKALTTGKHFFHKREIVHCHEASDVPLQQKFLSVCEKLTGVRLE